MSNEVTERTFHLPKNSSKYTFSPSIKRVELEVLERGELMRGDKGTTFLKPLIICP